MMKSHDINIAKHVSRQIPEYLLSNILRLMTWWRRMKKIVRLSGLIKKKHLQIFQQRQMPESNGS